MKRLLPVLGLILLVLAIVTAVREEARARDARVSAHRRLTEARDGALRTFATLVEEGRVALASDTSGNGSGAPPAPLHSWGTREGDAPDAPSTAEFTHRGALEILVRRDTPSGAPVTRFGRIRRDDVIDRLVRTEGVGAPVAADATDDAAGSYEHLAVVDADGRVALRVTAAQLAPAGPAKEARHGHRFDRDSEAEGLSKVRRKEPCVVAEDGQGPIYKGQKAERVLGSWAPLPEVPGAYVLVEATESEALRAAGGFAFEISGYRLGTVRLWYVLLGASLLVLVTSGFLWAASREGDVRVLLRVYEYAASYKAGIATVILAGALFSAASLGKVWLTKRLTDVLVDPGPDARDELVFLAWATVGIGIAMAATLFTRDFLQNYYSTAMIADVRTDIGGRLVRLPLGYFQKAKLGDLVARLERDVASLRNVLNEVFETAFTAPFVLAGALLTAFIMNWRLALVLIGLPLIVYPLFRIAKKVKKRAEERQLLLAEISHVIFQMLAGIKVVKAFSGEATETERLRSSVRRYMKQSRKLQRLSALSKSLLDVLQMAGGAILVWVGGNAVLSGSVSLGVLMGFMIVVQTCYQQSKEITSVLNKFIEAVPGTKRVFEIKDAPDTLPDGPDEMPAGPLRRGIELRGVRFAYGERPILRGIDLVIPAGKVVALVGPTGAGKTTLCDLVARFYDTTEGAVLFDGEDVRRYTKKSLLRNVAIVTQDAFLFNAPLHENLRYGRPDATDEQIQAAARDAFVHDEIVRMEKGYDKMAGERGTSLSGGQRQRVTIARALLKDAPVLILDEATSALDSHAESQVQAALAKLMSGRTVLVVAHRLSTIRNADHVVVLDQGEILEQGPPSELLERPGGRFREMWERQMGEERKRRERGEDEGDDGSADGSAGGVPA